MKKKYRKAVYISLEWLITPIWWLFYVIATPFAMLLMLLLDWKDELKTKLKVRSYDKD